MLRGSKQHTRARTETRERRQTCPPPFQKQFTTSSLQLFSPTLYLSLLRTSPLLHRTGISSTAGRSKSNEHMLALGERREGFSRTTQTSVELRLLTLFMTLLYREQLGKSRSDIKIRYRSKEEYRIILDLKSLTLAG